jgi:hypothetical protein
MKRPDLRTAAWGLIVVAAMSLFVSARTAVQVHNTLRAMDASIRNEFRSPEPCR